MQEDIPPSIAANPCWRTFSLGRCRYLTASSTNCNYYVIVFMDYLTKWVEAFAIPDQKAETIAHLFVDNIVCRHGIPEQLLSDRGANFLSELILDICKALGVSKINTSGYHPQMNDLVEKFNSTLISLVAKCFETKSRNWDDHLLSLLFAYRLSVSDSTLESPFFLLIVGIPAFPHLLCCRRAGASTILTPRTTRLN